MTLDKLNPGKKCKITGLFAGSLLGQRLMSMGIYPGTTLDVIRNAPLEDPMEIRMEGNSISLRHEEAKFVEVELL
ncbi:MAG: iron transporter FeoA [Deltaproteobacteria bacterium]|nr:MAG: iron transporter FeoA [Deltaproteobacteria bacterium]